MTEVAVMMAREVPTARRPRTATVACVAGALAGTRVAGHVPQRQLGRAFAALVTAVAA